MILLTARAFVWLIASAVSVRVMGGQSCARRLLHARGPLRVDPVRARQIAAATHRAARVLRPRPACLSRALAAGRMLSAEGLEARITLGVASGAPGGEPFAAHAWLTHGDAVLTGEQTSRTYLPLCTITTSADPAFVLVA